MSDHTIICGYGRVGQMLAAELAQQGQSLVILDRAAERVAKAVADGFLAIEGNAVDDDVLSDAGLFHARTLATVLPDDATNVFITLTARDLCDSICIIARAECPTTERKLLRAGASHVVMPAAMGAIRIAQLATTDKSETVQLPEARYRMLQTQPREATANDQVEVAVRADIEVLANLASDLTRSVAKRQSEQLVQPGHES